VHVKVAAAPWVGQSIEIRVRAAGKHNRFGQWSDAIRLKVLPPLPKPVVNVEAVAEGVRLSWPAAAGAEYRVYRLAPLEPKPSLLATVKTAEYVDNTTQYGKLYQYQVQTFVASGNSEAESEGSEPASITPVDKFPPAVPAGLAAVAGVSSIEVTWNPDTAPDLRGYWLFRSVEGAPFEKIGSLLETPSYSDHAVEAGKHYRYQVSAVDQIANESARSQIVEMVAP
jgi:fibronectin type 3 domain-containing protein